MESLISEEYFVPREQRELRELRVGPVRPVVHHRHLALFLPQLELDCGLWTVDWVI